MDLKPKILEGRFVRLEPLEEAHREVLRGPADDPEIWEWMTSRGDGAHFDSWFDKMLAGQAKGDQISHAVYRKSDGDCVGHSAYLQISTANAKAEIGWTWYRADARGTAVNPECKLLLLGNLFDYGAHRVELKTHGKNMRSQNAMLKMGARAEGTLRQNLITWKGDYRDTAYFSVLENEWPSVKDGLEKRLNV